MENAKKSFEPTIFISATFPERSSISESDKLMRSLFNEAAGIGTRAVSRLQSAVHFCKVTQLALGLLTFARYTYTIGLSTKLLRSPVASWLRI